MTWIIINKSIELPQLLGLLGVLLVSLIVLACWMIGLHNGGKKKHG